MKQTPNPLRPASAALFAALAFSTAPVFAQDSAAPAPVIAAPPPTITAPPAPVTVTPPVATAPRATPAPQARTTPRAARPAAPARTATRAPVPARAARPAPTPAAPAPAPEAAPIETAPPPVADAAVPPPPAAEPAPAPAEQPAATTSILPWIIGAAALLILALGFLAIRRRRPAEEYFEETYEETPAETRIETPIAPYAEPALAAAPFAPEPTFGRADVEPAEQDYDEVTAASIEEVEIVRSDAADVEALAADSAPVAGRPWIEFLLRPLRAGTSRDNAIVQFELTVGNTGSVSAKDVRISTWVVAAGEGTDMERSLIEPPAEATHNEIDIAAGDGARVEAKIAMSKEGLDAPVLPVVVADARYTLPDGSEGRTHASFAIGVPEEDGSALQPFRIDGSSGLRENVEARLYGEPERV
ncbi:MAG TPA: hypothetical protein VEX35_03685 [Allosphingosinicella sp.]|nr:hypothetical protein [Allosphingosinicella sp.]